MKFCLFYFFLIFLLFNEFRVELVDLNVNGDELYPELELSSEEVANICKPEQNRIGRLFYYRKHPRSNKHFIQCNQEIPVTASVKRCFSKNAKFAKLNFCKLLSKRFKRVIKHTKPFLIVKISRLNNQTKFFN